MEPEYPFEWAGVFSLPAGRAELLLDPGPDPAISMVLLPIGGGTAPLLDKRLLEVVLLFSATPRPLSSGGVLTPGPRLSRLDLPEQGPARCVVEVPRPGHYALFTLPLQADVVASGARLRQISASRRRRSRRRAHCPLRLRIREKR